MIDPTPIQTAGNEWINPAVIQQVLIVETFPLKIVAFWPTNTAMEAEGNLARDILKAWGIMDEEGNLPENVGIAITAAKLGLQNGGQQLRPVDPS